MIDAATLQAYRETEYRVALAPPLVLRVGVREPGLAELYRRHGVAGAAFVTACNPRSRLLAPPDNALRNARLRRCLEAGGHPFFEGVGEHPGGAWPGEPSFLVLGLSARAAKALGRRFDQNAILWCGADAMPQLRRLR
jgi:hypothetical protein